MRVYWNFAKYLFWHKYYVARAGFRLRVYWWQLLIHDWSKLCPWEIAAYANFFGGGDKDAWKQPFKYAWNHHQKMQKHHWQYWVLIGSTGKLTALEMPEKYVREMVADWIGAGMAKSGVDDSKSWFLANKATMLLHPRTEGRVYDLLDIE